MNYFTLNLMKIINFEIWIELISFTESRMNVILNVFLAFIFLQGLISTILPQGSDTPAIGMIYPSSNNMVSGLFPPDNSPGQIPQKTFHPRQFPLDYLACFELLATTYY